MDNTRGRVIVVDDDQSVLAALRRLFESHWFEVLTFDGSQQFLEFKMDYRVPSCLVLDVRMPDMNGLDLQLELRIRNRTMPIIFITGHGNIPMSVTAMKRGAHDFFSKPVDDADLLAAVAEALHEDLKTKGANEKIQCIRGHLNRLTPREFEILQHIISGLLNKQIASELNISEKTVKVHRARVMTKMDAHSVADLVRQCELVEISPAHLFNPYD